MKPKERGVTLVELLISLALASFITAAMATLLVELRRVERSANALAEVYENGQLALDLLQYELRMAGFSPMNMAIPAADLPCANAFSWMLDFKPPLDVQAQDFASVLGVPFNQGCLRIQAVAGSDILWIRRIAAQPEIEGQPLTAGWYLWVATQESDIYPPYQLRYMAGWHDIAQQERTLYQLWALHSRIYYLRAYSAVIGDGVPSLVMASPHASGFQHQVLVEGIDMMQFEWLFKEDELFYRLRPVNPDQLAAVKAVTLYLLVRHRHALRDEMPIKHFQLAQPFIPDDQRFFREVFSSSVLLRNQGGG